MCKIFEAGENLEFQEKSRSEYCWDLESKAGAGEAGRGFRAHVGGSQSLSSHSMEASGAGDDVVSPSTVWRTDCRGESGKINSGAAEKVHVRYDYIQKKKGQDQ